MPDSIIHVPHEPWPEVAERLQKFSTKYGFGVSSFSANLKPQMHHGEIVQFADLLRKHRALSIVTATLNLNLAGASFNLTFNANDAVSATLNVGEFQNLAANQQATVLSALADCFEIRPRHEIVAQILPGELRTQIEAQAFSVSALRDSASEIAAFHAQQIEHFDEYWVKKNEELDKKADDQRQKYEDLVKDKEAEFAEKEADYEKKKDALDLEEAKGKRRQLLHVIQKLLAEGQYSFDDEPTNGGAKSKSQTEPHGESLTEAARG